MASTTLLSPSRMGGGRPRLCRARASSSSRARVTTCRRGTGIWSPTRSRRRRAGPAPSPRDRVPAIGAGSLDSISPAFAVLAGLVSFVSPCVLPLVPAYLAYLGARAGRPVAADASSAPADPDPLPVALAGVGFVAGLSLVFILFFYVFSLAVQPFRTYVPA